MSDRIPLPEDNPVTLLCNSVIKALYAIPVVFSSPVRIEGIPVIDLFAINTLLGSSIENQTVISLNEMRNIWDKDGVWSGYEFRRYPESFPDVRLVSSLQNQPALGIELKGWYLLSKEEEPSFRFRASPNATTIWDLLVVFPWALSNVISGTPVIYSPFIEQAQYAANLRNYYWENRNDNATSVRHPDTQPYPPSRSEYSDIVDDDRGGNFGRIARISGLMDEWISQSMKIQLAGIEAKWWVKFFKLFSENKDEEVIERKLSQYAKEHGYSTEWIDNILHFLLHLINTY